MLVGLLPCRFCENPPGTKSGPPSLARCLTDGCEARQLGAETFTEWNDRNRVALSQQAPGTDADEVSPPAKTHVGRLADRPKT